MTSFSFSLLRIQKLSVLSFALFFLAASPHANSLGVKNTVMSSPNDFPQNSQAPSDEDGTTSKQETTIPDYNAVTINAVDTGTLDEPLCEGRWIAPDKIALPAACKNQNSAFPEQASLSFNCEEGPFTIPWAHSEGDSSGLARSADNEMAILTFSLNKIKDTCWALEKTGLRLVDSPQHQPVQDTRPDDNDLSGDYSGSGESSGESSGDYFGDYFDDFTFSNGNDPDTPYVHTVSAINRDFIIDKTGCADIETFCFARGNSVLNPGSNSWPCADAERSGSAGLYSRSTGLCLSPRENSPDQRRLNNIIHLVSTKESIHWQNLADEKDTRKETPFTYHPGKQTNQQPLAPLTATGGDKEQPDIEIETAFCQCADKSTTEQYVGILIGEDSNNKCTYFGPDDEPQTCHDCQILTTGDYGVIDYTLQAISAGTCAVVVVGLVAYTTYAFGIFGMAAKQVKSMMGAGRGVVQSGERSHEFRPLPKKI